MRPHPLAWAALCLPALSLPGRAQEAARHVPFAPAPTCGLRVIDGVPWAGGRAYKAEFRRSGVVFTPALGARAPHNLPLGLELAAVGRGTELQAVGPAEPRSDELHVRYDRGACIERYEITPNGLEQSFVFERPLPGRGDLVVRLLLQTELPLAESTARGLRFSAPDLGGVAIGAVTGIDAAARTAPGTITCDGTSVELRLPAAFVDAATYPLVLDPQIGPDFAVTTVANDDQDPEVAARSDGSNEFLVVYERQFSATDRDLRGYRLSQSGSILGSLLLLTTSANDDTSPAVGVVTLRDRWVVAFERAGDVWACPVSGGGTVGTPIAVAQGSDTQTAPDVGGDVTGTDDDVVCVYYNATQGKVQAQQIQCSLAGTLSALATVDLASSTPGLFSIGAPRIAHDGGAPGRYLVVYPRTMVLGNTHPRGIVINRNLGVLATAALSTSSNDEDNADVDGNGTEWVVAFESEATSGSGDNDIHAAAAFFDPAAAELVVALPVPVTNVVNTDEIVPAVGYLDSSCIVAWRRRAAPGSVDTEVFLETVDLFACTPCEPTILLANTTNIEQNLTIATGKGSAQTRALVLWESSAPATGSGDLYGIAFEPGDGGIFGSPGAGCGDGGRLDWSCARVGNSSFRVRVREARPSATSWLVLSPDSTTIVCGSCQLHADPFTGFLGNAIPTDARGNAELALPIPNSGALQDAVMFAQWIVSNPAGSCAFLASDFSTARAIHID